jgi:hypothetical protein
MRPSNALASDNNKAVGPTRTDGFALSPLSSGCRTERENPSLARCDQRSIRTPHSLASQFVRQMELDQTPLPAAVARRIAAWCLA